MRSITFICFAIFIFSSTDYSQTQLLKVGNAIQYSYESNMEWIVLTNNKVEINGKEYFERKGAQFWIPQSSNWLSFERIDSDSAYYALTSDNSDSLIFNYNWKVGHIIMSDSLSGHRIDSIKIMNTYLDDDTIYFLKNFFINPTSGDTNFIDIPEFNRFSKKIGALDFGLWYYATGVKVNGVRYGEVYPFSQEIIFSEDSLYSNFVGDTVNCYIKNTSDYEVVLDSICTSGKFPYGYLSNLIKGDNKFFINLFNCYPNHPLDTLNYTILPNDSVLFQIYDIDLCAICKKQPDEYFEDTLRFVFSFNQGNEYSFSKSIIISGEGHLSDVEDIQITLNKFVLSQNFPNPFNPKTIISWQSPISSWQTLKVYDVLGNEVAILVNEYRNAGKNEIEFDAHNLASGIYYYQLKVGNLLETKKMILLK